MDAKWLAICVAFRKNRKRIIQNVNDWCRFDIIFLQNHHIINFTEVLNFSLSGLVDAQPLTNISSVFFKETFTNWQKSLFSLSSFIKNDLKLNENRLDFVRFFSDHNQHLFISCHRAVQIQIDWKKNYDKLHLTWEMYIFCVILT